VVLQSIAAREHIAIQMAETFRIRQAGSPPVLGHGGVQVIQVVAIENHLLGIHLGPAHAQMVVKRKFSRHEKSPHG